MDNKRNLKKHIEYLKGIIKEPSIAIKLPFWFIGSLLALFGIYELMDYFQINFIKDFTSKNSYLVSSVLIAIIVALFQYVRFLVSSIPDLPSQADSINSESDSILEMLKEAETHSRWTEIIKIGSALSDVLWYTSRKKLRLAIGRFVRVAATQLKDEETLSQTLIDDIGNTEMVLGNPDQGIKDIMKGIDIAEKNGYIYLQARGYRNLANSYALKKDATNSKKYLLIAEQVAKHIPEEITRLEALGGISYAKCRAEEAADNYPKALSALDECINYYQLLSKQFPQTASSNNDRIVKVYREKGVIYLKMHDSEQAQDSLAEGLRIAQGTLNHENIVRCCILLVELYIDASGSSNLSTAEGLLNIAKQHIDKTDIPSVREDYQRISKKFSLEKESTVDSESN